ncbi:GH116 family glycosyl hydrolase, partial [SCandidatus Aminicenantes bacterium Aminicenantia_JdfR_composite]|nr:GH116 family glycosyl hydrolase [SCandidatus Aminicenantes bacterium Aminicenantia_JdfR_composite]
MHELSQGAGYINWFGDYPYGFYHAETTPYYIISLYDYIKASGDLNFLQESWPSIKKAYQYILSTDTDNDGLMENSVAGMAALELGAFLGKTKTDIYLAGLSTQAWKVLSEMAELMKDYSLARKARNWFQISFKSLNEKFWLEKEKKFCFALTIDGGKLKEDTVWVSVPMIFKLLDSKKAKHVLQLLSSSKLSTDWGVRMLSKESLYYNPLNYNYGTVWPFVTGYATLAEFKYNHILSGFSHLKSLVRNTFTDALGFCSELFSGEFFIPIEEAVPFQIFSSSPIITATMRGLLGLEGNTLKNEIRFSPQLPGNWNKVEIENYRIGENWFNFKIEKK